MDLRGEDSLRQKLWTQLLTSYITGYLIGDSSLFFLKMELTLNLYLGVVIRFK